MSISGRGGQPGRYMSTGTTWSTEARAEQATKEAVQPKKGSAVSPDLDVVKRSKGPVMTVVDEFYKVGPGPSSSPGRDRINAGPSDAASIHGRAGLGPQAPLAPGRTPS